MDVSLEKIKRLRGETSAGILHCKEALQETRGDFEKAKKVLRKKGIEIAEMKSGKKTTQGKIASYVHHNGKMGALVEVHCQSDFIAKNSEFQEFSKNIAMHVVACNPQWNSPEDIPAEVIEEEKAVLKAQVEKEGKPVKIMDKIIEGRIRKFYARVCLLEQPFFRDDKKITRDYLQEFIAKVGENIEIYRFVRYELRGEIED
jgi:elongation factor Ts